MNEDLYTDELHDLIDALSDDSITPDETVELNRRLETDPIARQIYLDHMSVEAELGALHSHDLAVPTPVRTDAAEPARPVPQHDLTRRATRWFAIALSVVGVTLGSAWITFQGTRGVGPLAMLAPNGQVPSANTGELVARITGTRNCRWLGDRLDIGFGSEVYAGQILRLDAGLAEVTFNDGPRLVLEGPAEFFVPGSRRVELLAGRMSASVPRNATDFSVGTPRLEINNAGTQFGLIADADGSTEVHVFEGPLQANVIGDNGRRLEHVELSASEAGRLPPTASKFALFRAANERFVRTLAPVGGPNSGLLAVEQFVYPMGPLAWQNGGFGWAGPWADIEAADPLPGSDVVSTNSVGEGSMSCCDLLAAGNRAIQTGQRNRIRRALSTSIGGVFDAAGLIENADGLRLIGQSGKTIYVSFVQRVSRVEDVFYGFEMHRGDGNFNRVLCIGNGADGSAYGVTSNYNNLKGEQYQSLGSEDTQANLIVVRIDYGADNNDLVTVYRNPTSLIDERLCTPSATMRGDFAFDRLSLGNFDGAKVHEVDEIRVGITYRAATGQQGQLAAPLATNQVTGFDLLADATTVAGRRASVRDSAIVAALLFLSSN